MDPVTNPLAQGALTSEHDKITRSSGTAGIAMAVGVLGQLVPLIKDLDPRVELAIVCGFAILFLVGLISQVWLARQYSKDRTALKIASLSSPVKAAAMITLILLLAGCETDKRISTARDAAARYEDTCVQQHMAVHAVEQKSLADAQAADIAFKTKLNVDGAVAAANANPAIKPSQLAADIARSYQEQQILLNNVNANISSLQQQIAGINAYHDAAQKIFAAIDQYDAVPSVTATGVATAATTALSGVIKPANSAANKTTAAVPVTPPVAPIPPTTVALPVPGQ